MVRKMTPANNSRCPSESERLHISIIRGCFVNEKREIVSTFSKSPISLPESEAEHYLASFKKTLGGATGRNQFSIHVHVDDSAGKLLRQLQTSELTDEKAISQLYKVIIDGLEIEGSYLILAMHDAYSVPYKKGDEHTDTPDFSDKVFNYIIVSICPVKPTKPLLTFFRDDRDFHTVEPGLAVGTPSLGFMYPIFDTNLNLNCNHLRASFSLCRCLAAVNDALHRLPPLGLGRTKNLLRICSLLD